MRLTWKTTGVAAHIKCCYGIDELDWFIIIKYESVRVWDDHNLWKLIIKFQKIYISTSITKEDIIVFIDVHLAGLMI